MQLNLIDGIILALVMFGVWRGYVAGFIREFAQLLGVLVGFGVALNTMRPAGIWVKTWFNITEIPEGAASLFGFVIIFGAVYVVVYIVARLLERIASSLKLGAVNHLLGGGLGAVKTTLMLSILIIFLAQVGIPGEGARNGSYLYTSVEKIAPEAWQVFTSSVPKARELTRKSGERFWIKQEQTEEEPHEPSELERVTRKRSNEN